MGSNYKSLILKAAVFILIAVLSLTVVTNWSTSTDTHRKTIASLDEKKNTVIELTTVSAAASAAITLIPGDVGTPIADKLADLSGYFVAIFCAVYLEKYLVTITGYVSFAFLIPLAMLLLLLSLFWKRGRLKAVAAKLIVFGLVIYAVIPTSIQISNLIENTYQESIQETIDSAKESSEEIQENANGSDDEDENALEKFIDGIKGGVTAITTHFEELLSNFIDAIAVLLVTSCLIPILVILFFVWFTKILFGLDIHPENWKLPKGSRVRRKMSGGE